ncbi:MAG: hypothetical protein H6Q55_2883 [Deltaproteobacteria bacterium]|jgi:hypothetical protein|nr:hypothetical protein [Deltaproteobacteria bacterium]
MIKNSSYYDSFKRRALAGETLTLDQKYKILEALYEEARRLGQFGNDDLLLGIQDDIRLAAALNANVSNPPR